MPTPAKSPPSPWTTSPPPHAKPTSPSGGGNSTPSSRKPQPSPTQIPEPAPPPNPSASKAAKLRGTATHRILELLFDLTHCLPHPASPPNRLPSSPKKTSSPPINPPPTSRIQWFLWHSSIRPTNHAAAQKIAAGDTSLKICRELPFAWTVSHNSPNTQHSAPSTPLIRLDPADHPTIRGIIDLLLLNPTSRTAEIFDYKTDSAAS